MEAICINSEESEATSDDEQPPKKRLNYPQTPAADMQMLLGKSERILNQCYQLREDLEHAVCQFGEIAWPLTEAFGDFIKSLTQNYKRRPKCKDTCYCTPCLDKVMK